MSVSEASVAVERRFAVNDYQLAAKEWRPGGRHRVLALHGWLDNAASFDCLAPLLTDCHVVALDMPGHGHSDHKSAQASYNLWDDLLDVLAVADELGWQDFHLLGHSRGALMSFLLTAAIPERVRSAVLMDAIWPQATEAPESPAQLAKYIRDNRSVHKKKLPRYRSFEEAVAARTRGFLALDQRSAERIVERGIEERGEFFYWRNDPRLTGASAFKLTHAHSLAFSQAITQPCLLLAASGGLGMHKVLLEELENYPQIEQKVLEGGHHFHMEDAATEIARLAEEVFAHAGPSAD